MNLLRSVKKTLRNPSSIDPVGIGVISVIGYLGYQIVFNANKPGTLGYKLARGNPATTDTSSGSGTRLNNVNIPAAAPAAPGGGGGGATMDTCRAFNAPLGSGAPAGWDSSTPTWQLFSQVATGSHGNKAAAWSLWVSQNGGTSGC